MGRGKRVTGGLFEKDRPVITADRVPAIEGKLSSFIFDHHQIGAGSSVKIVDAVIDGGDGMAISQRRCPIPGAGVNANQLDAVQRLEDAAMLSAMPPAPITATLTIPPHVSIDFRERMQHSGHVGKPGTQFRASLRSVFSQPPI